MNTKNKTIAVLMAMIVAIALPMTIVIPAAIAQDANVNVPATVTVVGGDDGSSCSPPIIKAKWELPDDYTYIHGIQIAPPDKYEGTVPIYFWVVVTEPNGIEDIDRVYVEVFHPNETLKYQVELAEVGIEEGIAAIDAAEAMGIITYGTDPDGNSYDRDDLVHELQQFEAKIYTGEKVLHQHQPYGEYRVLAYAYDQGNEKSEFLENSFTYVRSCGFDLDFTALDFGEVKVSKTQWISGDTVWDEPPEGPNPPTVRNRGNGPISMRVCFDDMGFGMRNVNGEDVSNVHFDARFDLEEPVDFDPDEWAQLPGELEPCHRQKLSFSIHVDKADPDVYPGTAFISSMPAEEG